MLRIDKIKFFLFLLIFFHVAVNLMVLMADKSPLLGDQFNNFLKSGHIYSIITGSENFPHKDTPYLYGLVDSTYPPLMYLVACLFFAIGKFNVFFAVFSISLLFCFFIFYSFKTYALFMKKEEALWCSAVLSFVPGVYGFSRVFHVDFVLASMITAATYYIFAGINANKKHQWFLAGLFTGLGFLSKQSIVVFMFPLWCYMIVCLVRKQLHYLSLIIYGGLCFAVGSFWYFMNLSNDNSLPFWALATGFDFFKILVTVKNYCADLRLYLLGNAIFLFGFLGVFLSGVFNKEKITSLFLCLVFFPLMFFSFFSDIYSVRYLLPFVFFLCFFISSLFKIIFRNRRIYYIAITSLLVFLIFNYVCSNINNKFFTADDLILKDDKLGLHSSFEWNYDVSALTNILKETEKSDVNIATLFNTIDTDYLRYALWKQTTGSVLLEKEGLMEVFYGKDFDNFINEYDILLVQEETDIFLLEQKLFKASFIDDIRTKIEDFKNEHQGFIFNKKIKVTLGGKDYFYLVFISSRLLL